MKWQLRIGTVGLSLISMGPKTVPLILETPQINFQDFSASSQAKDIAHAARRAGIARASSGLGARVRRDALTTNNNNNNYYYYYYYY